jgi:nucleoid-associated protein YgaU
MAFADGKLGKLTFIFYLNSEIPGLGIPYTPMYNPTSFSVSHSVTYDGGKQPNSGDLAKKVQSINARVVNMELFFDGTEASPSASTGIGPNTVLKGVDLQVEAFLKLAYQIDGEAHRPHYIMLLWGTFVMTGVLKSANVNYTMFSPDGRPLRAKMSLVIEEHVDPLLLEKKLNLLSPDLSKSIIVQEGDTLPLLCYQEYNDASLYIKVAEVNQLKNYRKLTAGMELLFPPVETLD